MRDPVIKVVIPARNEAKAIGKVLSEIPDFVSEVVVADNGSSDETAAIARKHRAVVVHVPEPGYGRACLAGIREAGICDIVVFLDGDASDYPEDMSALLEPISNGKADLVIGSRTLQKIDQRALTVQQRFGNKLACFLIFLFWRHWFSDLGPFRAITKDGLDHLDMQAPTFGWTVEMQVRAVKQGLRCVDVPVRYRKSITKSQISGTLKGVVLAGGYIIGTIFKEALRR